MKALKILSLPMLILIMAGSCRRTESPNIIYINADDLGWKDLGVYGSNYYETPNLDRLAETGMRFTNAYSAAANCAPSRACLMTGLYTPRHGIYTVGSSERGRTEIRRIIPVENTSRLDTSLVTIAEELKRAGYVTASIGKWHLGPDPRMHGFDINVGGGRGGPRSYFAPYIKPELEAPEGEHLTDRLTQEAIAFLEEHGDNKFFLYLPYFAVHTPHQGKEELIEKYRNKPGSPGQGNAVYAAMVDALDQNIGILLEKLEDLGLSGRTIVFFAFDNGGIRAVSSQDPLRAGKGSYYEGGIRGPFIVRWSGRINAGTTCDVPVINVDVYPTLVDLAGINDPLNDATDGQSLVPLLLDKGEFNEDRSIFWHFPIYLQAYNQDLDDGRDPLFRTRPGSAIRTGDWKLHEYFEDGELELYNLKEDTGERFNLAAEMPDKATELRRQLTEWRRKTRAPIPTKSNPDFNPDALPE